MMSQKDTSLYKIPLEKNQSNLDISKEQKKTGA
jgi:hypothetical protein